MYLAGERKSTFTNGQIDYNRVYSLLELLQRHRLTVLGTLNFRMPERFHFCTRFFLNYILKIKH